MCPAELASKTEALLCDLKALVTVRNTFLHFNDAVEEKLQQPNLVRALTAPAARTSQEQEGDVLWEEDVAEQAMPDVAATPQCLDRLVTMDHFEGWLPTWAASDGPLGGPQEAQRQPQPQGDSMAEHTDVQSPLRPRSSEEEPPEPQPTAFMVPMVLQWRPVPVSAVAARVEPNCKSPDDSGTFGCPTSDRSQLAHTCRETPEAAKRTTVMLRNLPISVTREVLVGLLDAAGFVGMYDFLYMPIDFRTHAAMGYVFLNLTSAGEAVRVYKHFDGLSRWPVPSGKKTCSAGWSNPHQGLEANVERYLNSPLMHESVPDHYRPMLFSNGMRVPFPSPTKKVKPPRQGTQRMLL